MGWPISVRNIQKRMEYYAKKSGFPKISFPRYVPSEDDFWKVYDIAEGKDESDAVIPSVRKKRRNISG